MVLGMWSRKVELGSEGQLAVNMDKKIGESWDGRSDLFFF